MLDVKANGYIVKIAQNFHNAAIWNMIGGWVAEREWKWKVSTLSTYINLGIFSASLSQFHNWNEFIYEIFRLKYVVSAEFRGFEGEKRREFIMSTSNALFDGFQLHCSTCKTFFDFRGCRTTTMAVADVYARLTGDVCGRRWKTNENSHDKFPMLSLLEPHSEEAWVSVKIIKHQ